MDISSVTNAILLTSATLVGLRQIYMFLAQPKKKLEEYQKKQQEELLKTVRKIVQEELLVVQQEISLEKTASKLILATKIEKIYWDGFQTKTLHYHEQELIYMLYETYKELGGNGHIDSLMAQIKSWEVIHDK